MSKNEATQKPKTFSTTPPPAAAEPKFQSTLVHHLPLRNHRLCTSPMSYGMGSDEDTVPLTHHGRRGGGHGTRSGSNRSKRGNSSKASRFAKELYGDTYSTSSSSSSSSSSFRTKAQRRDTERRHTNFLAQEMKKQDQLIKEQDSSLEMLSSNLTRLGDISHVVSRELDQQADMLDDLDKEVNKGNDVVGV